VSEELARKYAERNLIWEKKRAEAKMNKWISTDERFPKLGERVLITYGYDVGIWEEPVYCALYDGSWTSENVTCNVPTHWMPIPEEPKGKDE
jgi:hypothetical protein